MTGPTGYVFEEDVTSIRFETDASAGATFGPYALVLYDTQILASFHPRRTSGQWSND